jgi:hypothetical protein
MAESTSAARDLDTRSLQIQRFPGILPLLFGCCNIPGLGYFWFINLLQKNHTSRQHGPECAKEQKVAVVELQGARETLTGLTNSVHIFECFFTAHYRIQPFATLPQNKVHVLCSFWHGL